MFRASKHERETQEDIAREERTKTQEVDESRWKEDKGSRSSILPNHYFVTVFYGFTILYYKVRSITTTNVDTATDSPVGLVTLTGIANDEIISARRVA